MKMLAEKLNFYPTFTWSPSWTSLVNKVDYLCEESMQYIIKRKCLFQSSNRDIEISLANHFYDTRFYLKNNIIGPVSLQEFHFITGAPPERQDYLTFIMPFDFDTWVLSLASVVGVSIALILIDKIERTWSQEPSKYSIFRSKCPCVHSIYCINTITNLIFQILHLPLELSSMRPRKYLLRRKPIKLLEALTLKLKY